MIIKILGDIKPLNIMRMGNQILLIDFDASAIIGGEYAGTKYSSAYLPPEMFYVHGDDNNNNNNNSDNISDSKNDNDNYGNSNNSSNKYDNSNNNNENIDNNIDTNNNSSNISNNNNKMVSVKKYFSGQLISTNTIGDNKYEFIKANAKIDVWSFGMVRILIIIIIPIIMIIIVI